MIATEIELAHALLARRSGSGVYVLGLTGGVACGKSTFAASLADTLRKILPNDRVEVVNTDGFLRPNAALEAAGLLNRKGFPETYDHHGLVGALHAIRKGPTAFPGYSHIVYDVDPALSRVIAPPALLIVEGLGLDSRAPLDDLMFLDAEEFDQERWFVGRFLGFCAAGRLDAASFYARFRDMEPQAAAEFGAMVWRTINLPNLREHLLPLREHADIVVRKSADHGLAEVRFKPPSAR